jgi:23S rRNA (uracil747-C5)-methyltransferase
MKLDCSYYNQEICRSCTELSMDYPEQIMSKEKTLSRLLGVSSEALLPTITSPLSGFRSKAKFVITGSLESPIIGLSGLLDLDRGREILNCPLHDPQINALLTTIKSFITLTRLAPYEIKSKRGEIKGLILYISSSSEMYLRLILRSKESLDRIRKNSAEILKSIPQLKVLSVNIQPIPHAILEGEEEIFITEREYVNHEFGQIQSKIHPRGFVQTNSQVAAKLYQKASEWIQEIKPDSFCELFSGQGAFSLTASPYFSKGLGVEINPEAVTRANLTAEENGLTNLRFISRDASLVEQEVSDFNPDVLLVNPPRRGLGEALPLIKGLSVSNFIYSSCSAESLAKDLKSLEDIYRIKRLQIFDMFPHTKHFETLVWLEKI